MRNQPFLPLSINSLALAGASVAYAGKEKVTLGWRFQEILWMTYGKYWVAFSYTVERGTFQPWTWTADAPWSSRHQWGAVYKLEEADPSFYIWAFNRHCFWIWLVFHFLGWNGTSTSRETWEDFWRMSGFLMNISPKPSGSIGNFVDNIHFASQPTRSGLL